MTSNQYEDLIDALQRVVSDVIAHEKGNIPWDSIENAVDVLRTCGVDVSGLERTDAGLEASWP